MQVPHRTQSLPPAFSAMLPPMVQAQALVGSVAKTRPRWVACSMAASVMTPASRSITCPVTVRPSSSTKGRADTPRMRFSFSVFTITQSGVSGMAPPVRPVPAPRGMAWSFRSRMAARSGATCDSSVGVTTASGRCSRQSVASVAWAVSVNGSSRTFSRPTTAPSARRIRAWRSGMRRTSSRTPSSMRRASARTSRTSASFPAPSWMTRRFASASPKKRLRRAGGGDQLLAQVRVAPVDQHLAEDPHEEPGRASGDPALPQLLELLPDPLAEQRRDRLPVVGGRVVVGDLAVAGSGHGAPRMGRAPHF